MTIKEFAETNNISLKSAREMMPLIEGAEKCPCCNRWNIPPNAKVIYKANKNYYKTKCKKICYVLDAISLKCLISPGFSGVDHNEYEQIILQLQEKGFIKEKANANANFYDCSNYTITINGTMWFDETTKTKNNIAEEIILQLISIVPSVVKVIVNNIC